MIAKDTSKNRVKNSTITSVFLGLETELKCYLMRFLINKQDIEDAVQETFIRAYKAEETSEIHSPKSFLFKIAKNFALSELTKKSNQLTDCMGDMQDSGVIDDRLTTEDQIEMQQKLAVFYKIAASMPPQCQKVLVMRKVFGFSRKEISRQLNISVKTVENHLTRALQLYTQAVADDERIIQISKLSDTTQA